MTHQEAAITKNEEQEKVNYLYMRFIDLLELPYKENKRVIDITCPLENEDVNYLSMRFMDFLELPYKENKKENKRVIDITCPLENEDKDFIVTITIKELNEKGVLKPSSEEVTLMTFLDFLNESDAREMDVTIPRWNEEVVVATIKISVQEKTVA